MLSNLLGTLTAVFAVIFSLVPGVAFADFAADVARIDAALKKNPSHVLGFALDSCLRRRAFAIDLYEHGHVARAERTLKVCFHLLKIPEIAPVAERVTAPTQEELNAKARESIEEALSLTPDPVRGLEVYRECAACHNPEGWGLVHGGMPQIAGQHHSVVIKQLADIRIGNRDNAMMAPYAAVERIGGPQAIADVAGYIEGLEINVALQKGPGTNLELGERLYADTCASCHGPTGEGNAEIFAPRIQAQNYHYLQRQFQSIRDGTRRNANPEMVAQIQKLEEREIEAVLDYVSRLEPPLELQAPPDWKNPDFVE